MNEDLRRKLGKLISKQDSERRVRMATDFSKNLELEERIEAQRRTEESIAQKLLSRPIFGAGGTGGGAPVSGIGKLPHL